MAAGTGKPGGGLVAVVALGAVGLAGAVALFGIPWVPGLRSGPDDAVTSAPEPAAIVQPQASAAPEAAPDAMPASAPDPAPDVAVAESPAVAAIDPPGFDTVRVAADGSATIAGRAPAGSTVSIRLDGDEVASASADGQGAFAALVTLAPSDQARLLSLVARLADGTDVESIATVAIAPIAAPAPAAVAEAAAAPAPEVAPPAAILLTENGAQVLQAPEAPAQAPAQAVAADVTVAAITYAPNGDVQMTGKGQGGAALRLYLDNAELAILAVDPAGNWAAVLPEIAPGLYTLRADQLDGAGNVTSRFETPFQRETLQRLAEVAAPPEPAPDVAPEPAPEPVVEVAPVVTPAPVAEVAEVADPAPVEAVAPDPAPTAEQEPAAVATLAPAPEPAASGAIVTAAEPAPAVPVAPQTPQPVVADVTPPPRAPVTITVQPGFTLWQIAQENLGNGVMFVQVFEANADKIRDPDLIYPGQVFTVPTP